MGTDLFLWWDGMSRDDERKRRIAAGGFRTTNGGLGCLRASIWMKRENFLLRHIPAEFWESRTKSLPYDFKGNYDKMFRGASHYLRAVLDGKDVDPPVDGEDDEIFYVLQVVLENSGVDKRTFKTGELDLIESIAWLKSLFDFFKLGAKLQDQRRNPKVMIRY
jgi:hypothetical protein